MKDTHEGEPGESLDVLHRRLEAHFADLHAQRRRHPGSPPIFALEHGLSEAESALLKAEVCSAVRRRDLPRKSWLPFVVYAAELGYEYCGDEYWQTFESRTPAWAEYGDRYYVQRTFRRFKEQFGGAEPSGRWARHFSIICWPITHAVLPTDLQRQLAQLLYEYRGGLTTDLLNDPAELGKRLAARSWNTSSRFQYFAQNAPLLGQVAAALLIGDDEDSPYLLHSTLQRIVTDLSQEREARVWLRDAKSTASRVRIKGLGQFERPSRHTTPASEQDRLSAITSPKLWLERQSDAWTVYMELPDLGVLAERLPDVHDELGRLRARVAGVTGPPLARGWLLYPGQRLRLDKWPVGDGPLVQLEGGSSATNSLLGDQCLLPPGPCWLFRKRDRGLATEVRGKFVRPAHQYLLISEDALGSDLLASARSWIRGVSCTTGGVSAYEIDVPAVVDQVHVSVLRALGLGTTSDVEVRPAGLVPALWDGEGRAEWLAGETATVVIAATHAISRCIFTLDANPHLIVWPPGEQRVFVRLGDLAIGYHDFRVSLLPEDDSHPVVEGSLGVAVRSPVSRGTTGTFREGLMILPSPANPTLTELWDGKASLELRGPSGVRITLRGALSDASGKPLAVACTTAELPVDASAWQCILGSGPFREDLERHYDEAESCVITASHPALGAVSLRCEREFAPLRWTAGRNREGPFLRLINNTECVTPVLEMFEFRRPDVPIALNQDTRGRIRAPAGGLVVATVEANQAEIILPPYVRSLDGMVVTPRLEPRTKSRDEVERLIALSAEWLTAVLPADPFAAMWRTTVLRTITSEIVAVVAGERWARLERQLGEEARTGPRPEMEAGIGDQLHHRVLAQELRRSTTSMSELAPEDRPAALASALSAFARRVGVAVEIGDADFILRLASEPATLRGMPSPLLQRRIDLVLTWPVLLRAARFVVLAVEATAPDGASGSYRGWAWT